jgi:two-component system phosphate regulon response regulator PhoB
VLRRVRPPDVASAEADPAAALELRELRGPLGLLLDPRTRRASLGGAELTLSRTEFNLLQALLREPGRVFDRQALLDTVWGSEVVVGERTVDVHVKALRHKLDAAGLHLQQGAGAGAVIETVRGVGYRLKEP